MAKAPAKKDAISLLKADHRKVEELFEKFENARGSERKRAIAQQICTELVVHSTIEEEIFYPACQGAAEEDKLDEAYVEHDGAKVLISEIANGEPDDEFYDAKVKVLKEMIKHHVKEEERPKVGIMAAAREADLDLEALGQQLMQRKEELMAEIESGGLPDPQTRSFTGHTLVQSAPVAQ